jgi:GTP-binding protein Era
MVGVVKQSVADVEVAALLVEPVDNIGMQEEMLIEHISKLKIPAILVINKIDTVSPSMLLPIIERYSARHEFDAIVPISAKKGSGIDHLKEILLKYAVEGPRLFPEGMTTDQPENQIIAEIIREKLLICMDKEIPHGTAIEITKFAERDSNDGVVIDVDATIYCERASHKGMIIGKNGAMLKKIGQMARIDIERFMGAKVFLQTWVKVRTNWRDNEAAVRNFGYKS